MDHYATVTEIRRLDGIDDAELFPDTDLEAAIAFGVETVEEYTGAAWTVELPPPVSIRWAVRTIARQWLVELHSRLPDRAMSMTNEYGQINLAQAGGPWRPTSQPEVNAVLNRYRERPPF